jgi:hypothetical protein
MMGILFFRASKREGGGRGSYMQEANFNVIYGRLTQKQKTNKERRSELGCSHEKKRVSP